MQAETVAARAALEAELDRAEAAASASAQAPAGAATVANVAELRGMLEDVFTMCLREIQLARRAAHQPELSTSGGAAVVGNVNPAATGYSLDGAPAGTFLLDNL